MGLVQWHAARTGSPYLKTIIPRMAPADYFIYGMNYRGGAFKLRGNLPWSVSTSSRTRQNSTTGFDWNALLRHIPILTADEAATGRPIDFYRDWVKHSTYDDFWKRISNYGQFEKMDLPILQIGGWFDVHVVSTIANYEGIAQYGTPLAQQQQKVIMGPWVHTGRPERTYGDLEFGPDSVLDLREVQLRWLDHWLKDIDNGAEGEPALNLFLMGDNTWRGVEKWPLPETRWTDFLDSDGRANSLVGDGRLSRDKAIGKAAFDTFTYDPADPVPTLIDEPWDDRPVDYRPVERRDDVLVYTTAPLTENVEVTGPVQARLYASSSATDKDWTVRLLDVYPSGKAIALCDGILRARFREPAAIRTGVPAPGHFANPELVESGTVYPFTVEVGVTSNIFAKGHRVRIEVSSSNFPRFDRNLNNGGELGVDPQIVVANQTIYHDERYPSFIQLPVIPRPVAPSAERRSTDTAG